jgi:hypothetical protein
MADARYDAVADFYVGGFEAVKTYRRAAAKLP